ncbi:pyridoxal phosphate-dependent aminotransferase [Tabrizicola sp.]|uniref:pyridoxal phosphate-dependent aminotransferase n=1 Tax=Tabrizicola sp. TaxID=2005166 RepID=UPI00286B3825|nr:pyridoxal phosphate-dependent aminotransferase [Tabrizicola sp.]
MRYASVTERLSGLGGEKWALHARARAMKAGGEPIIEMTIGEPDIPTPTAFIDAAYRAMQSGRTGYSNGRGEPALVKALAARYSQRRGRLITPDQVICLPGTQTTLYTILRTIAEAGDEVLVGDPMYATYEGIIAQSGARMVPVPLRPEFGFRMQVADVAARITPASRVLFLNTPHNPTGALLRPEDLAALGALAKANDLWIVSDEVYEEMVFPGVTFASPLDLPDLADRVISACSISKSHAAPGFRSGWCIGPVEFCRRLLPLSETMLFGSQPFIADMTALAISEPSPVSDGMVARFSRRAGLIADTLDGVAGLRAHRPEAGMFTLIDVRATGLSGTGFAEGLLAAQKVAVMPGESFGQGLNGWIRLSLTQPDDLTVEAAKRIAAHAAKLLEQAA